MPVKDVQRYDNQVQFNIESGAYNRREDVDIGHGVKGDANFCNVFTSDVAKVHGVDIPTLGEIPSWLNTPAQIRQNAHLPARQKVLNYFWDKGSKVKGSGITKVSKEQAKKLADKGELVIFSEATHSSVIAPNIGSKWSVMYRSDQANRQKKKLKIGYNEPRSYGGYGVSREGEEVKYKVPAGLYHIDPEKFKQYRDVGIKEHNDALAKNYGEPYPTLRR
jgi:hypothetical protein